MIIDKITIQDFGVYAGRQQIELTPKSKERPVILIGGLNGGGKTTLLDALQLCMYGKYAKLSNRGKIPYENFLKESIHRSTRATSSAIEIEFRQLKNGHEHRYKVLRSWNVVGKKCKEHFVVETDGELDLVATQNWDEHVDRFLPRQIAPLFFFDGEKIEEYADPEKTPELIETAIHGLLGLDTVDQLLSDLNILEKRKRDDKLHASELEKVKKIESEIASKQAELDQLKQESAHINTNSLANITNRLSIINEEYRKKGGDLYERRYELENGLIDALKHKNELDVSLRRLAAGAMPLLLNSSLLNKLKREVEYAQTVKTAQQSENILKRRNKDLIEFMTTQGDHDSLLKKTIKYLDNEYQKLSGLAAETSKLSPQYETSSSIIALQSQIFTQITEESESLNAKLCAVQEAIETFKIEIDGIPAEDAIKGILQKRKELTNDKSVLKLQLERNQKELERRQNDLERSRQSLKKMYEKAVYIEQGREDDQRLIHFSGKSRATLEEFRERVIDRHLEKIQRLVFESFSHLARKSTLVSKVAIDRYTFSIRLYDLEGNIFGTERLSAGERQLLSIAILWGLSKASGRPLPIVIDTPLGRLDGIHRTNLINRYFPNASHQVILLSTDKEIGAVEKTQLQSSIGREYTLSFDDNARCTTILDGYITTQDIQHVS